MSYSPVTPEPQDEDGALMRASSFSDQNSDQVRTILKWHSSERLLFFAPRYLNFVLAVALLAVLVARDKTSQAFGIYENGFRTDLGMKSGYVRSTEY
jgi:hypothetical protein